MGRPVQTGRVISTKRIALASNNLEDAIQEILKPEYLDHAVVAGYEDEAERSTGKMQYPLLISINNSHSVSILGKISGIKLPAVPCV